MEHAMDANNVPPLLASGRAWSNPYLSNDDQAELEAMLEQRASALASHFRIPLDRAMTLVATRA